MPLPFPLPPAYTALAKAGRFDYWGAPYRSLSDEQRARLMAERRPNVLWWKTIEWDLSLDEVLAFKRDERLRPGLVPFAGNGYGDQYCWYPRWQTGQEPPIVLAVHDELESSLFARSFGECLCRCMLASYALWDLGYDGDLAAMRHLWSAHAAILHEWIQVEHHELLAAVGSDLSPEKCATEEAKLAIEIGGRKLVCFAPPTKYAEEYFRDHADLLRCYDQSIGFYREVMAEGWPDYDAMLTEAQANRDRVAAAPK